MAETLPKDNQILMVVNCAKTWQEVVAQEVYICPAEGAAYSHRPNRYFGVYHDRKVSHVANLEGVIDVQADGSTTVRWTAFSFREAADCQKAVEYARRLRTQNQFPVKVLLLGKLQPTDFKKDSKGGLFGNVKYFDVSELGVDTAGYLAQKLNGKKWSQLGSSEFKLKEPKEDRASSPGMYTPFQNWLVGQYQDKKELQLRFEKIEEILGVSLPYSAREYTAWWLDKSVNTTHTHALAWLEAGWEVEKVDLESEKVTFRHISKNL